MAEIPTGTVVLVGIGGVLVYAGLTAQNPLAALRAIASGKPADVPDADGTFRERSNSDVTNGGIADVDYAEVGSGGGLPTLPRAVERYASDRYSQAKRMQKGYSDCSSFVGKGLKLVGVHPPGGSTTAAFLASKDWKRVSSSDVQPGDVAISFNHMIVCYGNGYGIGQQNPRVNVQRGKVDDLMFGNKPYIFLRYKPGSSSKTTGKSAMV